MRRIGLSAGPLGPRRIILPCFLVFSVAYASLALLTPHLFGFILASFSLGWWGGNIVSRLLAGHLYLVRPPARRALSIMLAGGASAP